MQRTNCECADSGCPCEGRCDSRATETVFRIDMEDETGTAMCESCANDAHMTGLFRSTFEIDDEDERIICSEEMEAVWLTT